MRGCCKKNDDASFSQEPVYPILNSLSLTLQDILKRRCEKLQRFLLPRTSVTWVIPSFGHCRTSRRLSSRARRSSRRWPTSRMWWTRRFCRCCPARRASSSRRSSRSTSCSTTTSSTRKGSSVSSLEGPRSPRAVCGESETRIEMRWVC